MSLHWTVRCETHEVWGPDIRMPAEGYPVLWRYMPRRHPDFVPLAPAASAWERFLREHEYCDLRLVHE